MAERCVTDALQLSARTLGLHGAMRAITAMNTQGDQGAHAVGPVDGETTQDESAEVLYDKHHRRIQRLCQLLLRDPYEAEDITQEVFEKLLVQMQTKNAIRSWQAWLTTVTVNACRDRRRSTWWKWWRRERPELQEDGLEGTEPTPEQQVVSHQQRVRLWTQLQKLSARQREVFTLRRVEGLSTEEVATLLGLTSGSVKRHLYHALQHLQKALGDP
ncbi:MAG: RNA polymerase sigma factor [Candidatus Binatia bacterium]